VIGGVIIIAIFVMFSTFPSIANIIIGTNDSTEYAFAFPDIDNSVLSSLFPAELIGGVDVARISAVDCFFKFTLLAKDSSGGIIEIRQSQFSGGSGGENPFTTFSISTVPQTTSGGEAVLGGRVIDRYEITPKIRCDRDIQSGEEQFETGIAVLASPIKLTTAIVQPDGSVKNLGDRSLTIQTIGLDDRFVVGVGASIFPPTLGQQGILRDNVETEFKGTLGATKSANEFFTIPASSINNLAEPQLSTYNTEVRFAISGNLNMNYIFVPTDKTQIFPVYSNQVAKTVIINVDRIQDVPPEDFPQSVILSSAITGTGKCLAGLCGSFNTLNPDAGSNERTVTVNAILQDFQGVNVEGAPTLRLVEVVGGSLVSGITNNPTFMQFIQGDSFRATMTLPSSIADATYIFQVTSPTRSNTGVGTFSVVTPPPDQVQPPTCNAGQVLNANNICVDDPTNGGEDPVQPSCPTGFILDPVTDQCISAFCPDGTSAINGCTITSGGCLQGEIRELDGTCSEPLCQVGEFYDRNLQRCTTIDCGTGSEFDTLTLQCITVVGFSCEANQILSADRRSCVNIGEVDGEFIERNIFNIRQELRYRLVTTDQSGARTPVESGIIPPDESLFAGLTPLQFLVETETNPLGVKFDVLEIDSFLVVPPTVSSPQITNVNLNQNLFFYHKNPILTTGIPSTNSPALAVNLPMGTLAEIKTPTGSGFFALGKMEITTSDILSSVAPTVFGLEEQRTTTGGVELKEGDVISVLYVIDGDFDLTTDGGTKEFDGVIKQMRYWKNLIYTDKDLNGDECIGKSGRDLLQCQFDSTGNNSLEGLCPPDTDKTEKQNFDECLASLDDRTIDLVINKACEDTAGFDALIEILNVESGFTEEFGGTGVKSTEDILRDLQLASGCDPETVLMVIDDEFKCASGTFAEQGITPTSQQQCFDQCSQQLTGFVGGEIHIKDDGTTECRAPPMTTNGGLPQCQSGSMRDMETNECVYPPATPPSETTNIVNGLLDSFQKFLESFTNSDDKTVTGGGGSGGKAEEGGACGGNILNCIVALFGDGDDERTIFDDVIPPQLQIAGSSTNTIILFAVIIFAILIISTIVARRRRRKLLG